KPSLRGLFYNNSELRSGWRLAIYAGTITALTSLGNSIISHYLIPGGDRAALFLTREVMDLIIIIFVSWIMGRIEGRTLADYGFPWRRMFRKEFWQGAMLGFATITVLVLLLKVLDVFKFSGLKLHGAEIPEWAVIYVLIFILVAVREELRYRGYGLFTLATGIGFWPAAIISSVYFAYTHSHNPGETPLGLFNVAVFGLFACFLLRRTGNLWMPIGLHL